MIYKVLIFLTVCAHAYTLALGDLKRLSDSPRAGVTGSWEPPSVDAGSQQWLQNTIAFNNS